MFNRRFLHWLVDILGYYIFDRPKQQYHPYLGDDVELAAPPEYYVNAPKQPEGDQILPPELEAWQRKYSKEQAKQQEDER